MRELGLREGAKVTTLVGKGLFEFGDVNGSFGKARLQHPLGLAFRDGMLYVADSYNAGSKYSISPDVR